MHHYAQFTFHFFIFVYVVLCVSEDAHGGQQGMLSPLKLRVRSSCAPSVVGPGFPGRAGVFTAVLSISPACLLLSLCGFWRLNSGCLACTASTLLLSHLFSPMDMVELKEVHLLLPPKCGRLPHPAAFKLLEWPGPQVQAAILHGFFSYMPTV